MAELGAISYPVVLTNLGKGSSELSILNDFLVLVTKVISNQAATIKLLEKRIATLEA